MLMIIICAHNEYNDQMIMLMIMMLMMMFHYHDDNDVAGWWFTLWEVYKKLNHFIIARVSEILLKCSSRAWYERTGRAYISMFPKVGTPAILTV